MFQFLRKMYLRQKVRAEQRFYAEEETQEDKIPKVYVDLAQNLSYFRSVLGGSADVKTHEFLFGNNCEFHGALVYIDGLVSSALITESILKPLILNKDITAGQHRNVAKAAGAVKSTLLCSGDVVESESLDELIEGCLNGDTVLLYDGHQSGLVISTRGWEKRSVAEPQSESVVRGPREGFTENFRTSTALLRRRIKSPRLRMEHMVIGRKTLTNVCVAYIDGVADPSVVELVKYRLEHISVDGILDTGNLEAYIEDEPFSVFSTVAYSEKPDVVAAKVLEGRVAIIADGSPFVLTVPMLFIESFQTAEDYYTRTFYASITRLLRFIAYFLSIFAPAIYIALTTYHQELIPTTLLFTIAEAREGTPFPAFLEALIMVFSFEILKEAGLRLPRPVGQAVSIVGALVMGDAAVSAGLVGAPMVITIAITAVSGFVVPGQVDSTSILRLLMMILAAMLGGYGIAVGMLGILVHLAALKSFGVPYFPPYVRPQDMQDSFIRMPLWAMVKRPRNIARGDTTRKKYMVPPVNPPEAAAKEDGQ